LYPVGFTAPPGAEIGSPLHALNDHSYCCNIATECESGEPKVEDAEMCAEWHNRRLTQREKDATKLGVPLFLSEFGACLTEEPCTQEINSVLDAADSVLAGWDYWQYKGFEDFTTSAYKTSNTEGFYNQDGSVIDFKVKALAKPYMPLTQGRLNSMKYDRDTNTFTTNFTLGETTAPSVAYLNSEYYYPSGINAVFTIDGVQVSPAS